MNLAKNSNNYGEASTHNISKLLETLLCLVIFATSDIHAQHVIRSSTGAFNDNFGGPAGPSIGQSGVSLVNNSLGYGRMGLVGAYRHDFGFTDRGAAFLYKNLQTASGSVTQNHTLLGEALSFQGFGASLGLTQGGNMAVVGAPFHSGVSTNDGAAYVFRNLLNPLLPTTVAYDLKLIASDRDFDDGFGIALAVDGDIAVVGASQGTNHWSNLSGSGTATNHGSAYVYRNLSTKTVGTYTEDIKLMASDGNGQAGFGMSPTIRGSTAIVGAYLHNAGGSPPPNEFGAAYIYRNLDTWAAPTKYEDAKLVFPHLDGTNSQHRFGYAISLNETATMAAVGAFLYDMNFTDVGVIFVYKDLLTVDQTNPVTGVNEILPDVALRASDNNGRHLGYSVSLSGDTLLAGAPRSSNVVGAVYMYDNLSSLVSNITTTSLSLAAQGATVFAEQAKIWISSPGLTPTLFGSSVALDGNGFMAGAAYGDGAAVNSGAAYTGDKRTFLGLDSGATSLSTNGLSFWSRQNWVIGDTTAGNQITITAGDTANVNRVIGTETIIGNSGFGGNTLSVLGTLNSYDVNVGVNSTVNVLNVFGSVNVAGTASETGGSPGARNLTIGVNAAGDNNTLNVSPAGLVNVDGTTTIGRSGSDNIGMISGTLNTAQLRVGQNAGADDNLLFIANSGSVTVNSTTIVGAGVNSGNEMRVMGTFTGNGTTTINTNSTLSGTGTVGGLGVKNIFGKHTPNHDGLTGVQTISGGDLTMHSGSLLHWDLTANTTAGRGTVFDGIDVLGPTNVTVNAGATILLSFDNPGSSVNWVNTFWDNDYTGTSGWLIYSLASGTFSGMSNFTLAQSLDAFGQSLAAIRPGAYFYLYQDGNDVYLNYRAEPIPEPAVAITIFMSLFLSCLFGKRLKLVKSNSIL